MITKNVLLSTVSIFILHGFMRSIFVNAQISSSLLGRQEYGSNHLKRVMEIYKRYEISFNLCRRNDSWQSDKKYFQSNVIDFNAILEHWKNRSDYHKAAYFDFELLCIHFQAEYGGNISELFYALYVKYMSSVYAVRFAHEYLNYINTDDLQEKNVSGGYFRLDNRSSKHSMGKHRKKIASNLAKISASLGWFGAHLTERLCTAITEILKQSIPGFVVKFAEIEERLSSFKQFVHKNIIEKFDFKKNDFTNTLSDEIFHDSSLENDLKHLNASFGNILFDENIHPSNVPENITHGISLLIRNEAIIDRIIDLFQKRAQEKWTIRDDWHADKRSSLATDILRLLEFEKLISYHASDLHNEKENLENGLENEALLIQVKFNSQREFDRLIMEPVGKVEIFFANLV